MKKKDVIVIILLVVLAVGFSFYYQSQIKVPDNEIESVCFNEKCFSVEIADNDEDRARGLMFREKLEENKGMLFIFDNEGVYPFWMKNTLIALDIIWINSDLEIVYIASAVPCIIDSDGKCEVYNPNTEALYVLEVNSGIAEEIGLKIGDRIIFK